MNKARRSALHRIAGGIIVSLTANAGAVRAQTATYEYDALGRLARVTYPNGTQTTYTYDAAGNRTSVITGGAFSATITLSGAGPHDLRSIANANGYAGGDANVTFVNPAGNVVTGAGGTGGNQGGPGIDTGVWPPAAILTLVNNGTIRGGGGGGNFGNGGDAIFARIGMTINNASGTLQAGGGGGGAGGGWRQIVYDAEGQVDQDNSYVAGGGGGGFPNGVGGAPYAYPPGNPAGSAGTGATGTNSGGGGGAGATIPLGGGRTTGAGGTGGGVAAAGGTGTAATGAEGGTNIQWFRFAATAGGLAGFAVRKNGNTVTRNGGVVQGAEG